MASAASNIYPWGYSSPPPHAAPVGTNVRSTGTAFLPDGHRGSDAASGLRESRQSDGCARREPHARNQRAPGIGRETLAHCDANSSRRLAAFIRRRSPWPGLCRLGNPLDVRSAHSTGVAPVALDLHPDLRVLAFTAALAVLTAILFGLLPALRAALSHPAALLRQDSRTFAGRSGRLGQGLIVTQISLSLMLVLASTLFTRSFWNLRSADPGFERASVLNVWMLERPGAAKNFDVGTYYRELIERLTSLPGVRAAGLGGVIPGTGEHPYTDNVAPISAAYVSKGPMCDISAASPGFFDAIGMKILQGRDFAWNDGPHQPPVAIVSSSLAKRLFPQGNAIGGHVRIGTSPYFPNLEIVGVVNDARLYNPRDAHSLDIFTDSMQDDPTGQSSWLFVRAAQNPLSLISGVSQAIDSFGYQFVVRSMTLEEAQSQALVEERLSAMISSFFGGFALLLACMGLYGLISHSVTRRTREIGIRMALGAQPRDITQLVLRQALVLSVAGIVLGVFCSLVASRLLSAMLYGVSPNDVLSIVWSLTGAAFRRVDCGLYSRASRYAHRSYAHTETRVAFRTVAANLPQNNLGYTSLVDIPWRLFADGGAPGNHTLNLR